jgi:hypothetical protein
MPSFQRGGSAGSGGARRGHQPHEQKNNSNGIIRSIHITLFIFDLL